MLLCDGQERNILNTISIIGAGASGVICALKASENPNNFIYLFEKNPRVLKKILSTGNGKCNLSNDLISISKYNTDNRNQLTNYFSEFSNTDTINFFKELGLYTYKDTNGRIYPRSNQASSVVDILRLALNKNNICILTDHTVTDIKKNDNLFSIKTNNGIYNSDYVVITCGGPAAPVLGGTLTGISLLSNMGHNIITPRPSLVQIKTDGTFTRSVKGIKTIVKINIYENELLLNSIIDELLFTDYGVSGPAALNASQNNHFDSKKYASYMEIDFAHEYTHDELTSIIYHLINSTEICENLLTGFINKRLGQMLIKNIGIDLSMPTSELSNATVDKLVKTIKCFKLKITGTSGFENAQVVSGGAVICEFDNNLQSRIVSNLFAAGEVLNVDGICGGYNLQWAWTSGMIVGRYLKNA